MLTYDANRSADNNENTFVLVLLCHVNTHILHPRLQILFVYTLLTGSGSDAAASCVAFCCGCRRTSMRIQDNATTTQLNNYLAFANHRPHLGEHVHPMHITNVLRKCWVLHAHMSRSASDVRVVAKRDRKR